MPTEAEMMTKWCPMARIGQQGGTSVNRGAGDGKGGPYDFEDATRCLGSACAMWGWINNLATRERRGDCGLKNKTIL